jgi:hypothetical protein
MVTEIQILPQPEERDPFGRTRIPILFRFHFRVDEVLSGNIQGEIDVFAADPGLCGYHFEKDVTYVAFVRTGKDGRLWSLACTPTRPAKDAAALLPQLRAQRDGRAVASLFGLLLQGPLSEEEEDRDGSYDGRDEPLPFTAVQLRNERGQTRRAETGSQGEYAFFDLPAGTYRLWVGQNPDLATPPLQLPAGACYEYQYPFEAVPTGEIWGRVFDPGGKALKDSAVTLLRVEHYGEEMKGRVEYPDDNGYFHFLHVAPGKYYLVVNQENRTDSESPFPRTFFPGTTNRQEAIQLEIREDGRYPNADIRLKLPKPTTAPSSKP